MNDYETKYLILIYIYYMRDEVETQPLKNQLSWG